MRTKEHIETEDVPVPLGKKLTLKREKEGNRELEKEREDVIQQRGSASTQTARYHAGRQVCQVCAGHLPTGHLYLYKHLQKSQNCVL